MSLLHKSSLLLLLLASGSAACTATEPQGEPPNCFDGNCDVQSLARTQFPWVTCGLFDDTHVMFCAPTGARLENNPFPVLAMSIETGGAVRSETLEFSSFDDVSFDLDEYNWETGTPINLVVEAEFWHNDFDDEIPMVSELVITPTVGEEFIVFAPVVRFPVAVVAEDRSDSRTISFNFERTLSGRTLPAFRTVDLLDGVTTLEIYADPNSPMTMVSATPDGVNVYAKSITLNDPNYLIVSEDDIRLGSEDDLGISP